MKVEAIRTSLVESGSTTLMDLVLASLETMPNGAILAISSKVAALCQERTVGPEEPLSELIAGQCDLFLSGDHNDYGVWLTIKSGRLVPNAGVDRSNANGCWVLWPEKPFALASRIRDGLRSVFGVEDLGVIITDSAPAPLRVGVTGICIGYCGFEPIRDHIGEEDLFGQKLSMTRVNIIDALAAAAVLVMGEARERTPLCLLSELKGIVEFRENEPSENELAGLVIEPASDLFAPLLTAVEWQSGRESQ